MLAFMSQQAPVHTPTDTSTMSLAILPSQRMAYSELSAPTLLGPSPSPAKRPKLSLNTNSVASIFGKASTSLRLETLSATSPTARNTFSNAVDPAHTTSQKLRKPVLASLAISPDALPGDLHHTQQTPICESAESSATTARSISSIASIPSVIPYKLTFHTTSILVNSPLPRLPRRHSRPMFPAPKKVAFKDPLTEDVRTTRFTLRHSDIESSTSTISTLELANTAVSTDDSNNAPEQKQSQNSTISHHRSKTAAPHAGDKRESSDEEDSDHDSCPATPVAGRRKRHRQWVWTLPPVTTTTQKHDHDHDQSQMQSEQEDVICFEHDQLHAASQS